MSLNIDEQEARLIWLNDIMPFVFRHAKTQEKPVTVFLGGQPAAGKTSGQDLAKTITSGHHPDSRRRLPPISSRLQASPQGGSAPYARRDRRTRRALDGHVRGQRRRWGYPIIIEGTWRNVATVLDEARRCKA